jgi:transglutaminase-like putative cysteine protease
MSFDQGARLLSHLTALACFSALILNDQFAWAWSAAGLGLIVASLYFTVTDHPVKLAPFFWWGASVLFCLIFLVDLWFSGALLAACMHFLVYLMAYRLFHLEKAKDHLQLYLICFLQLLSAAGAGSGFAYAFSFIVSTALLIWGLVVQHLKKEEESRSSTVPARSFRSVISFPLMMSIHLLSVGALLPTLLIFFLIPRVGIGLFQKQTAPQKISGFSEKVDLGSMGPVIRDLSLVMRVIPSGGEKEALPYLRGMSFDTYDGKAWKNTLSQKAALPKFDRTFEIETGRPPAITFRKTILLEPIGTAVLFTVGSPIQIQGNFPSLVRDQPGSVYFPSVPLQRTEYEITAAAALPIETDRGLQRIDYPTGIREHYLSGEVHPRIVALAREVADPFPTLFEKVQAIERHLRSEYAYSLEVAPSDRPPLEDFLFYQKKGYCEYYASAMVMMLRSLGIASRLVTGFLPGEWNEFGKYYLVRQSDAHAWVEVYFPEGRWLPFDPTPAIGQPGKSPWTAMAAYVDWMQMKWERYIVRYSLRDQFALIEGTRNQVGRFSEGIGVWVFRARQSIERVSLLSLFLGGMVVLSIIVLYRRGWSGWSGVRVKSSKRAATVIYERMLRLLAKRGFKKRGDQTPLEFAERVVQKEGRPIDAVRALTELYHEARFGGKTFTSDDLKRAEALFAEIKAAI